MRWDEAEKAPTFARTCPPGVATARGTGAQTGGVPAGGAGPGVPVASRPCVCPPLQADRAEVVRGCLHPVFSKVFALDCCSEEAQKLRFKVYDSHGPGSLSYQDDDFLGGMECTLGQVGTPPRQGGGRETPRRVAGTGAVSEGRGSGSGSSGTRVPGATRSLWMSTRLCPSPSLLLLKMSLLVIF